jgi:hypothetical protein
LLARNLPKKTFLFESPNNSIDKLPNFYYQNPVIKTEDIPQLQDLNLSEKAQYYQPGDNTLTCSNISAINNFNTATATTTTRFQDTQPNIWPSSPQQFAPLHAEQPAPLPKTKMTLQPETCPISEEQLINKIQEIYTGLVIVEKKCMKINQQQSKTSNKLTNKQ